MGLDEVLHHGHERLVALPGVMHDLPQHVQDEPALGVDQPLVGRLGPGRIQPGTHPQGADIVGAVTESVLFQNRLPPPAQQIDELLLFSPGLQVEQRGKLGKPLRNPLVVVGGPTHQVPPPLVGDLVRGHLLHEVGEVEGVPAQKRPTLRLVHEGADRQIDQSRPGLAESKLGLLGDGHAAVRQRPEPTGKQSCRGLALFYDPLHQALRRQSTSRGTSRNACSLSGGAAGLGIRHFGLAKKVGHAVGGQALQHGPGRLVLDRDPVEFSIVETGHLERHLRFPPGEPQLAVLPFLDAIAHTGQQVPLGIGESHLVGGSVAEGADGGIPTAAGAHGEIASAGAVNDLVSRIANLDPVLTVPFESRGKDHIKARILSLAALNEVDRLSLEGDFGNPQGGQQPELDDPGAVAERAKLNFHLGAQIPVRGDSGLDVVVGDIDDSLVFPGTGRSAVMLALEMGQVPDSVSPSFRVEVDQGHLFRREHLRNAAQGPQVKTQVPEALPPKVSAEELRPMGIEKPSEQVGLDIVHVGAGEDGLGETPGSFSAVAHSLSESLQDLGRSPGRPGLSRRSDLLVGVVGKAEDRFLKGFPDFSLLGVELDDTGFQSGCRPQPELTLSAEQGNHRLPQHRFQEGHGA